ncbi:hypothetical protein D3C86_1866010 [compost metagenome]
MGEDGRRVISKTVEKMIGGIPHAVMQKAVEAIGKDAPEVYKTFRRVMERTPLETNDMIAQRLNMSVRTLYRNLRIALDFVDWYLENESEGWPDGAALKAIS